MPCLIVFSHLRWNFVYQRPQHLMSRLASEFRILFIEEPVRADWPARLDVTLRAPNIEVLVPHTPETELGFSGAQLPWMRALLDEYLATHDVGDQVAWFYTPMALPLLDVLTPSAVVYDCMDELASFNFAPHELREREEQLLAQADFVLTGGPALYEAKRDRHPQVICLPSAVDAAHFDPACLHRHGPQADDAALLQGHLRHPRIGFFGVIDERFDSQLIAEMAAAHPEWELVMAGPVVKIDPASLPLAPNIHWLGSQPYELLPYLLAGWDVCLLPFLINESTRFISPTKTLEYMAGEKPIVSTPVRDVACLYSDNVRFGTTAADIIMQCELALVEVEPARSLRLAQGRATVMRSSWTNAAALVRQKLRTVLHRPVRSAKFTLLPTSAE